MRELTAVARLGYWINERERIRVAKEAGHPVPWTDDPILAGYRFCNVRREDDRVTRWLKVNWRDPHARDPLLWHAMVVARYVNWPDTLAEAGWPEPWWPKRRKAFLAVMRERKARGDKVFTSAYVISNNGISIDKVSVVGDIMVRAYWELLAEPPRRGDTLRVAHGKLLKVSGVGSFMAAQVVADLKHTPVLAKAPDWHDWAAPGPGSARGLSRVRGRRYTKTMQPDQFVAELRSLRLELKRYAPIAETLCLQDLQNCLCEYDKYERARLGEGKLRATYTAVRRPRLRTARATPVVGEWA